jgi:serine/threonine protein kinase
MPHSSCLSERQLWSLAGDGSACSTVRRHLDECPLCRDRLRSISEELKSLREVSRSLADSSGSSLDPLPPCGALTDFVLRAVREERPSPAPVSPHRAERPDEHPVLSDNRIGKYEVRECLSRGGQASVFRAWDPHLRRDVAVKVSHRRIRDPGRDESRIEHEGALLAQLDHPHLNRVFDYGIQNEFPYLVMEYIQGMNLREFAARSRLDSTRIRRIMAEIADAVSHAHRQGILHLDLKPENVMVTITGTCKLIDFGMGWLFRHRDADKPKLIAGTFEYMSPEQLRGETGNWSPATDVYGLGGILCYLLTGHPPLPQRDCPHSRVERELELTLEELSQVREHDRRLIRICRKALAPQPSRRFRSVEVLRRELAISSPVHHRVRYVALLCGVLLLWWLLGDAAALRPTSGPGPWNGHRRVVELPVQPSVSSPGHDENSLLIEVPVNENVRRIHFVLTFPGPQTDSGADLPWRPEEGGREGQHELLFRHSVEPVPHGGWGGWWDSSAWSSTSQAARSSSNRTL